MRSVVCLVVLSSIAAAEPKPPTCGAGWRSQASTLSQLAADERGATLCAETATPVGGQMQTAESCVHLDFATGKFTDTSRVPVPAAKAIAQLDIPTKDAEELKLGDFEVSVRHDGARALVSLPVENVVAEFDAVTGKRLASHAVTTKAAPCVGHAFYIGDAIYAAIRKCDGEDTKAWMLAGGKKTATPPLLFASQAALGPGRWAVVTQAPFRVFVFDAAGKQTWSTRVPSIEHDRRLTPDKRLPCCYALGLTPMATLAGEVVAKAGDKLVVATPRGVALIDPVKKTSKIFRFSSCPS